MPPRQVQYKSLVHFLDWMGITCHAKWKLLRSLGLPNHLILVNANCQTGLSLFRLSIMLLLHGFISRIWFSFYNEVEHPLAAWTKIQLFAIAVGQCFSVVSLSFLHVIMADQQHSLQNYQWFMIFWRIDSIWSFSFSCYNAKVPNSYYNRYTLSLLICHITYSPFVSLLGEVEKLFEWRITDTLSLLTFLAFLTRIILAFAA